MPSAMLATYARCDRPPPLERLNEFRDDGRDARKFYTDPDYFFELWCREMLQDTERIQHDRGKKVCSFICSTIRFFFLTTEKFPITETCRKYQLYTIK
jgi:hypothetical protein